MRNRRQHLVLTALQALFVLISSGCQNPKLVRMEKAPEYNSYTESVNIARQSYLDVSIPEGLDIHKRKKLRGLANPTLLSVAGNIMLTTRNGFLHFLDGRNLDDGENTKITPAISAAPTYHSGMLFIASELGSEGLKAYNIYRGEVDWARKGYLSRSSPVVVNNLVLHAALNGKILALHVATGKTIWEADMKDKIVASMASHDGYLTAVSINGTVRTFDVASGSELWSLDLNDAIHTHPVISDRFIYITSYTGKLFKIHLIEGRILRERSYSTPFYFAPSVDSEAVYVPFSDGTLQSLSVQTLKQNWSIQLDGPLSTGILLTRDKAYCGTAQKIFYEIEKDTGNILNDIRLEGRPKSIPAIIDNRIYVAYERKIIACLSPFPEENQ